MFLVAPGINNWGSVFGDYRDWPVKFQVWVNTNDKLVEAGVRVQNFLYFTTALTVDFLESYRAKSFAKMISDYTDAGCKIHLFGHSNGTRVILGALKYAGWPSVETIHLINGAVTADWRDNGLNVAMAAGRVKRVFSYLGGNDSAMKIEDTWIGKALFCVGAKDEPLGLVGPTNVIPALESKVQGDVVRWPDYGHSDCWLPRNFDNTMRMLTYNAML